MKNSRNKIAALICALMLAALGLVTVSPAPVEASPTAYTYVQHVNKGVTGKRILVRCHTFDNWVVLPRGVSSKVVCGQNGWVEAIWNPDGGWLMARSITTGNSVQYGAYYKGIIAVGYYDVWLSSFCGGCGGGRVSN